MEKNVNDTPLSDFVEDNIGYLMVLMVMMRTMRMNWIS